MTSDVEAYTQLAAEISDACDEIRDTIPTAWSERAYSEITTAGYQPTQKHGVVVNIRPLVEAEIVPEVVDTKVI